jgi:hypothetical protein
LGVKPPSDDLATVTVLPSVVDTKAATSCHQIGKVAVALANKTARIAWALMAKGESYRQMASA